MKVLMVIVVSLFTLPALAALAPDLPPNACYEGCTPRMQRVLSQFESSPQVIPNEPAVYSGECYYLSSSYSGDQVHYSVVMIDKLENKKPYFSTIFGFFLPSNEFKSWNLETARKEMSAEWKTLGNNIIEASDASHVEVYNPDGSLANVYWMRFNPRASTIYYITYMGGTQFKAFCELRKNKQ